MSKFHLFESRAPYAKTPLGTYETLDLAIAAAKAAGGGIVHGESDALHPGCWDGFLGDGRVVFIEPEGFKI